MAKTKKKLTENQVVIHILELLRKRGLSEKDLTDRLQISKGSVSKWKYDGSVLYLKYLEEICEYLDTTPNYLVLGNEDKEKRLIKAEAEILQMYRDIDDGKKKCIYDTLKYFVEAEKHR